MRRKALTTLSIALAAAWSCGAQAEVVQANSNYFAGWQVAAFDAAVVVPVKGTPIPANVGGASFTITHLADAGLGAHQWTRWASMNSQLMSYGTGPVNIGLPTPAGNVWEMGGGTMSIKFTSPMPWGTTLFSHDIDGTDAAEYRIFRCNGAQADATAVEFIQISTVDMPTQTAPVPGAADSFWRLESPYSPPFSNPTGIVSGLQVRANDVCEIQVTELGRASHSTIDFMLGVAPAQPLTEDDTRSTPKGTPVTIDVRDNDTVTQSTVGLDVPTLIQQPTNGMATVNGSGQVVYTPHTDFSGTDTFIYEVCTQAMGAARRCSEAKVTVTVLAPTAPTPVPANSPFALLAMGGLIGWAVRRAHKRA